MNNKSYFRFCQDCAQPYVTEFEEQLYCNGKDCKPKPVKVDESNVLIEVRED